MPDNRSERPFVEPTITLEASLTDVTLLSGGHKRQGHGNEKHGGGQGGGRHGGEHHGGGGRGH